MSYAFLLKNLNRISLDNKKKLAKAGYLILAPVLGMDGRIQRYAITVTQSGKTLLGVQEESRSKTLRLCIGCGAGHWRRGKQFCSEECKAEKNKEKKKKELDFETIMKEIRARNKEKVERSRQYQREYYAENREKMLDYHADYRHRKNQEQVLLTILTTTI